MVVGALLIGIAVGAIAAWLVLRARTSAERRAYADASRTFQALSAEALRTNNESFLQLARTQLESFHAQARGELEQREQAVAQLVSPIRESLERFDEHARLLEASRRQAYGSLSKQVELLVETQERLRSETTTLVRALRTSDVRGRWGELQLRRALELSGMLRHCDFVEQPTASSDDGLLRPDVVVKLAGGKNIVVDAKVPLVALLDALQAGDDQVREVHLATFVRHVREHMAKLGAKAYWRQFSPSPEFVVMFLPSESFYRHAVEHDPSLLELGPQQRVILASPTTLISLLFAAAAGWRDETLAESARQVSELGRDLYERLATMGSHVAKLGGRLDKAVEAYNDAVGSLESRVLPAARRFPSLGVSAKGEIDPLAPIERGVRPVTAPELAQPAATLAPVELERPRDADAA